MDSDIDIEEHNLFENPELRVLFPDITALKQEIYEENIEVYDIQNGQTIPKGESSLELLEDSQHFDKNQQRARKTEHAILPNTPGCFSKYKIGNNVLKPKETKPTHIHIKHIISKEVKIILSDLKPVLQDSDKFCKVCLILFPSNDYLTEHRKIIHNEQYICNKCGNNFYQQGNLTRHLKNVHKINVRRKKTTKSVKNVQLCIQQTTQDPVKDINVVPTVVCFHCPQTFESKQLLIEHLYAVLEPKVNKQGNFRLDKSKKCNDKIRNKNKNIASNIQNKGDKNSSAKQKNLKTNVKKNETELFFKCPKCFYYYKKEDFFIKHMKVKHHIQDSSIKRVPFNTKCELCTQNCSNVRLYNRHTHNHKLISEKKTNSKFKSKRVYAKKGFKRKTLNVLKDIVFKCSKCDICFISPSVALNHTKHSEYRFHWKCTECQFTFKRNEGKYHLRQHTCSKSFTTIEINKNTFSKILYICSKCNIHYQEQQFIQHYRECDSNSLQSEYCDICDILIDQRLKTSHRDIHNEGLKMNTDFCIIKVIDKTISKQKLTQIERLKNNLHTTNLLLYYCKTCKCFVTQIHKVHRQSLCAKVIRHACRFCGLTFTNKRIMAHRSIHYRNPSITLQDFLFYDLNTGKKITPPMPDFPKCEGCNKHIFNKTTLNSHLCGKEADFICQICNMKSSEIVHKLHLQFHKYEQEQNIEKPIIKEICPLNNIQKDNVNSLMESKANDNNIVETDVYFCKICLIQIDSYDKVIQHCQLHILNNRDPNIIMEFLKQNVDTTDSVEGKEVYYFEPYYYGSKDDIWLKHIFNGLSPEEISKKIINSIYRFESRIKLEISQEGSPKYTEYKCMKCHCFIESSTLFSHVDGCGGLKNLKKYTCHVCKNLFISRMALSQHLQMHKNLFDIKYIRIVSLNQADDKQINELIKLNSSRPYYIVYRCRNCEGLVNKAEFSKHVCNIKNLQKCKICGLLLYRIDYDSHLLKHKNLNSFTESNIKVVLLGDIIPGFDKSTLVSSSFMGIVCDYSFYKCTECYVCIRFARCISPHLCLVDAAKAKCDLCDLYFDQGKIKGHMKLHSDDPEFVKDNIITHIFNPKESEGSTLKVKHIPSTSSKTNVVKIMEQDIANTNGKNAVLYRCTKCNLHYMSKTQAKEHIKKSPRRVIKQYCTKCGIPFSPNVLFDHLEKHHKTNIETTYVVDVFGVYKKRKIFQCTNCKLHFTNAKKTCEHYLKCSGDSSKGENCKCCKLTFHYSYLLNHENSTENNMHTDYEVVQINNKFVNNEVNK